jgi:hypothetical protein
VQVTKNGGTEPLESLDGKFLYYKRDQGIRKMPVDGGDETEVLRLGAHTIWALSEPGIALLEPDATGGPVIEFLHFSTGRRTQILKLPMKPEGYIGSMATLAISSDARWILYQQFDRHEGDIVLVESFR